VLNMNKALNCEVNGKEGVFRSVILLPQTRLTLTKAIKSEFRVGLCLIPSRIIWMAPYNVVNSNISDKILPIPFRVEPASRRSSRTSCAWWWTHTFSCWSHPEQQNCFDTRLLEVPEIQSYKEYSSHITNKRSELYRC
jgi:hypothetical protein